MNSKVHYIAGKRPVLISRTEKVLYLIIGLFLGAMLAVYGLMVYLEHFAPIKPLEASTNGAVYAEERN